MRLHPTAQDTARICHLLERGYTLEMAARACGIPVHTVRRWEHHGRKDLEDVDGNAAIGGVPLLPEHFPILAQFVIDCDRAKAVAQGRALDAVYTAACEGFATGAESAKPPDWRAAAWILERTAPDDFRERTQVDHGTAASDDETAESIAKRLIKARKAVEADGV